MSGKRARDLRRVQEQAERDAVADLTRTEVFAAAERGGVEPPWTPFDRTHYMDDFCRETNCEQTFCNSRYQVYCNPMRLIPGWPPMYYLSFKRHSRGTSIPWRDKQRLKNEICGTLAEAIELYPSEERLMDTSNQYHLFVVHPDCAGFPFGQVNRDTMTPSEAESVGAKQAALEAHHNADGCTTHGLVGWKPLEWYEKNEPEQVHPAQWKVEPGATHGEEAQP